MKHNKFTIFSILIFSVLLASCQSPETPETPPPEPTMQKDLQNQENEVPPTATAAEPEEPADLWAAIHQTNMEHSPAYVAFANPDFGITSCSGGGPHHYITSDGGITWEARNRCGTQTYVVDIVDSQLIFLCAKGSLLSSVDSWQSWNKLDNPFFGGCTGLSFLDDQIGWAADKEKLVLTEDGGNSWVDIPLPEGIQELAAISLRSPDDGYVVDFDQTLYSTNDGGQSWSDQTLDIEDDDLQLQEMGRAPAAAVNFTDDENGVVIMVLAGGGKSKILALHTSDGGQNWEHQDVPIGLGQIYLSHDGTYLTVTEPGKDKGTTILER